MNPVLRKVALLSAAASILVFFLFLLLGIPAVDPRGHPIASSAIAVSIFLIPVGYIYDKQQSAIKDAERRLPDFLRDLSNYSIFGLPMAEAVKMAASNDYGHLSPEIRDLGNKISVGLPVDEALETFGDKTGSADIRRVGRIIQKASESGNNTYDVVTLISDFNAQMALMRDTRRSEMQNYILVLLIALGVFIFVILIIDIGFFPKIKVTNFGSIGLPGNTNIRPLIERIFDVGIYVQGVGIGGIAGLLRDGRLRSGMLITGAILLVSALILIGAGVA
ncbi:type II secretion system F family protein [Oxyplasma meridianum]|uniref:Type II secretion system F family protein n=1 Tax=Oxyplasma meridianum TaxID=3073602 RepID=A0AAX4NFR2_9ARCH